MSDRILKDIRYYESNSLNMEGQSMPGNLGKIFTPTKDTTYIGQRIARKLNELNYSFGECDHIYINLTPILDENKIKISSRNIDKKIKYIDFGVDEIKFNKLDDGQKDDFIKLSTINILQEISNEFNLLLINQMARQLFQFETELLINYKNKEISLYKINISYQIKPKNSFTKAVIDYKDKRTNCCRRASFELQFYDDIYSLVDSVVLKNNTIILNPKKSFRADLYNERYKTPIELNLSDLEICDCY
jgi:hypothetical protein